ncbi:transcriptional repressor [Swaminathania salitolerans]|uniref:Transcriptional repressor n=1 Tax=Swaminathania salitolerans TaxID=182838 RepID=A0A511BQT6_9PROT|nr:transcriptional repressor [Swaminathania salitolerans]GBQ12032.1 Fur family transcriptional regulator [Swaminathania salitolerans LMG 21291]GEL02707.1 transcriptional repressor [Swaminathania salitolerans]
MLTTAPPTERDQFSPGTRQLLDRASAYCAAHAGRLTETRRLVLGLITEASKPVGAYDILDHLRSFQKNAAPPTVYRALDFLLAQGLIHRIERLTAFVGCAHRLDCTHEGGCGHRAQFLICSVCGTVSELEEPGIARAIHDAAKAIGFRPSHATVEIEGVCAQCQTR